MFTNSQKEQLTQVAIQASLDAGKAIMKIYKNEIEVVFKDDQSPLTLADQEANFCIEKLLIPTGIPIISEETKQLAFAERQNWTSCWIVDPLDGTKEFIKKNGEFTVNIALVENGKPILGVIYAPALNELYFGIVEQGEAYKIKVVSDDLSVSELMNTKELITPKKDEKSIRVVGSRSHMNQETNDFIENLKITYQKDINIVSKGSSLKLCLVAEGVADVYPRFAPTMEWDIAAGHAICNAVGLKVLQQNSDDELVYNKENLLNPYFLLNND